MGGRKNITIPSGWHEVNIRMFSELSGIEGDGLNKIVEIISILSDTDPEEIKKFTTEDLETIISNIQWVFDLPKGEPKYEITVDGKEYYLIRMNSLSLGEQVDIETYSEDLFNNMHKFFAVLYREDGEDYNTEIMNKRAELFMEKLTVEDCYCTLAFFLTIGIASTISMQDYSQA